MSGLKIAIDFAIKSMAKKQRRKLIIYGITGIDIVFPIIIKKRILYTITITAIATRKLTKKYIVTLSSGVFIIGLIPI